MLTDAQLRERATGIGGSDVAALCGFSKYKTRSQLFLEKTGQLIPQDVQNEYVYWGNKLENTVADEYAVRTGKKLAIIEETIRHPKYTWMLANIDRKIIDDNGVLECKTASSRSRAEWGESGTDNIPTPYLLQCAHYAIVVDASYVDLAVLIDTSDYRIYRYNRNQQLEKNLIETEKKFWLENVQKKITPDPTTNDEANVLWKNSVAGTLPATELIQKKIEELKKIKEAEKKLLEAKNEIEFLIKSYLQNNEALVDEFGNKIVTWKSYNMSRVDTDLIKKNYPDLYQQFTKIIPQRRFSILN